MKKAAYLFLLATLPLFWSATNNKAVAQEVKTGTNVGDKAPEIELNGVDGKPIKLSSLKGNYVLVDFWASWCGPCRRENPNVVEAYNKYKGKKFVNGKGFKIYSVSLDKQKDPWVNAIKSDNLSWDCHVSDLAGWQSTASAAYGVNSIPSNFLLDPNGVIIGKNLRGIDLHYAIEKVVKN
ncbi:MAG: TlpA disulfide reductase family protein [Bacteroidota bacterium]